MRKYFIRLLSVCLILVCTFSFVACADVCGASSLTAQIRDTQQDENETNDQADLQNGINAAAVVDKTVYVAMRINPEVEFVTDENGMVVATNAVNDDGSVVLTQIDFNGMSIEQAAAEFTNMAVELGYMNLENEDATVHIFIDGNNESALEAVETQIESAVEDYFEVNGQYGQIVREDNLEYEAKASEWGISTREAKMTARVLNLYGELTEADVVQMSVGERIQLVKDAKEHKGVTLDLLGEFEAKVDALAVKYSELFELKDSIALLRAEIKAAENKEARAPIQAERDALVDRLSAIEGAYRSEKDALKTEYREKNINARDELKAEIAKNAERKANSKKKSEAQETIGEETASEVGEVADSDANEQSAAVIEENTEPSESAGEAVENETSNDNLQEAASEDNESSAEATTVDDVGVDEEVEVPTELG